MTVMIVDGNNMLHRTMRVPALEELENRYGKPTGGVFGFLRSLQALLSVNQIKRCYVVFDGGISQRRRALLPEYKGPRYRDESDPFYEEPDEDRLSYFLSFKRQRQLLKFILERLAVHFIRIPGYEADDVIGHLSISFRDRHNVLIVSDDSDFLQLLHGSVLNGLHRTRLYRPLKEYIVGLDNFEQQMGYPSEQFMVRKSLYGDPGSDKIPGIPGVGKVTIEKVLSDIEDYEYPFDTLFNYCSDSTNKRIRKIADNIDIVYRNHEIIDLTEEEIGEDACDEITASILARPEVDLIKTKHLLSELDLFSIVDDLHHWVIPFQRLH